MPNSTLSSLVPLCPVAGSFMASDILGTMLNYGLIFFFSTSVVKRAPGKAGFGEATP